METMPSDHPTLSATLTAYLYCLLVLLSLTALCSTALWLFAPTLAEQYWYSFTNHVPRSRVFVSQYPMDCYADRATTSKPCHYDKVVQVGKDVSGNTQVTVYWKKVSE
jgi:hypothetical protein